MEQRVLKLSNQLQRKLYDISWENERAGFEQEFDYLRESCANQNSAHKTQNFSYALNCAHNHLKSQTFSVQITLIRRFNFER